MSEQPPIPESTPQADDQLSDRKVVPILPILHKKLGERLSPTATRLVVTPAGEQSRFWRGIAAIWHKLISLSLVGAVAITLLPHAALAAQTPAPGAKDARVRTINYDPDQVVSVIGQFRHAIEIEFGPGETVTQAALGDTVSWQLAPVGNIVFLKPREKAAGTNLIVITNGAAGPRTYHFSLTLGSEATMFGIRFHYPEQERVQEAVRAQLATIQAAKAVESTVVASALDHAVIEGKRNMNYTFQGDSALQPSEISDNGEFTVLRYPGHADIPSIFAVDLDGTETIVPYDVREDFVVIHAVYRELRLRRGNTVLCIWNEAAPRNERGDRTGTVSNVVERKVKGQ